MAEDFEETDLSGSIEKILHPSTIMINLAQIMRDNKFSEFLLQKREAELMYKGITLTGLLTKQSETILHFGLTEPNPDLEQNITVNLSFLLDDLTYLSPCLVQEIDGNNLIITAIDARANRRFKTDQAIKAYLIDPKVFSNFLSGLWGIIRTNTNEKTTETSNSILVRELMYVGGRAADEAPVLLGDDAISLEAKLLNLSLGGCKVELERNRAGTALKRNAMLYLQMTIKIALESRVVNAFVLVRNVIDVGGGNVHVNCSFIQYQHENLLK